MANIIDFEKKRREKLSSFSKLSDSQRYLRGEKLRNKSEVELTGEKHSKNDERQTREDALVELYIVETIEKTTKPLHCPRSFMCSNVSCDH